MSRRSSRLSTAPIGTTGEENESEFSELESEAEEEIDKSNLVVNTRASRGRETRAKIQEIEDSSDEEDSSSEEEEEEEGSSSYSSNDEYGKRNTKKSKAVKRKPLAKKARLSNSVQAPKKVEPVVFVPGPINFIPGDVFYEICRHLHPRTLLSLHKCSRLFRNYLAASDAQSVWKISRERVELLEGPLEGKSESQYANLLFAEYENCQICESEEVNHAELFLRIRICRKCVKLNWVYFPKFVRSKPALHPLTLSCVMTSPHQEASSAYTWYWSNRPFDQSNYGIFSDVYKYDAILQELELQDHVSRSARSGTKSRRSIGSSNTRSESFVDTFVRERVEYLKKHFEESVKLVAAQDKSLKVESKQNEDARMAILYEQEAFVNSHMEKITAKLVGAGRAIEDIRNQKQWIISHAIKSTSFGPTGYQISTEEVWSQISQHLLAAVKIPLPARTNPSSPAPLLPHISRPSTPAITLPTIPTVARAPTKNQLQAQGKGELFAAYNLLRKLASTKLEKNSFPRFADFLNFTSVSNSLREDNDWTFDQTDWDSKLEEIEEEVQEHRVATRIHAIKTILAATTLDTYENLSKHDDDFFNETKFDDDFFNNPTHFLVCNLQNCRRRQRSGKVKFTSFNDLVEHQHSGHVHSEVDNKGGLGRFYLPDPVVFALSGIIEVAELDDDTVTEAELNDIGQHLQWSNSYAPYKLYTWRDLINAVISKNNYSSKDDLLPIPTITLVIPQTDASRNGRRRRRRRRE